MEIEFIILTMSAKYTGYCVAGIDRKTGRWVRLVSANEDVDGALYRRDITAADGFLCKPLDIVNVTVAGKRPTPNQPENMLIDSRYKWLKIGKISQKDFLEKYPAESHDFLFGNSDSCISSAEARKLNHSLLMVKVTNLITYINDDGKTKATFWYNNNFYKNISVTDRDYFDGGNRVLGKGAVLVMSLANKAYKYQYYKFIAKIFVCD